MASCERGVRPHPARWVPWLLACLLLLLTGGAQAGVFDTPILSSDFDTANFSQYVDGNTTTITAIAPGAVVATTTTMPTDNTSLAFGDNKNPGTRHARIAFTANKTIGAILVRGDVKVSILKASATYPGNIANDSDWTACERIDKAAVTTGELPGEDFNLYYPTIAMWVVPGGAAATRAIRVTHTAVRSDSLYAGHLMGMYILSGRYPNLAPQGAMAPSHAWFSTWIPGLNNEQYEGWHVEHSHTYQHWDSGPLSAPISSTNPVTLTLVLPQSTSLRGIALLGPSFTNATVQYFTGSGNPNEGTGTDWTTGATLTGIQGYASKFMAPTFADFGSNVTTRGVRVLITRGADDSSTQVSLEDLLALRADLGSGALNTAVLTPTTTNAAIPITFTLASAGYVTLAINNSSGVRVRNLVSETYFPAGSNTVYWDGLDESGRIDEAYWIYKTQGKLVPTGTYTVTGLVRNALSLTYEFTPNTGNTTLPWLSRDNTGGWLADHSTPRAVCFLPNASPLQVLIASPSAEAGNGLKWVDLSGNTITGKRSNGIGGWWGGADYLARDAGTTPETGISAYQMRASSRWDAGLGHNKANLDLFGLEQTYSRYTYTYPDSVAVDTARLLFGGLAMRNKIAAISLTQTDGIQMVELGFDSDNLPISTLWSTNTVTDPRGLAFDANGKLLALSGTTLKRYAVNWGGNKALTLEATLVTGFQDPRGICLDPDTGDIYVSDWGTGANASHQVKVYTSAGTAIRTIGAAGEPAATATYNVNHMDYPDGLTISKDAGGTKRLWVAEYNAAPKRISVWTLTGTLDTALTKYGPSWFTGGGTIDPQDKTKFYYGYWGNGGQVSGTNFSMTFGLDWTNGTGAVPTSVGYRVSGDASVANALATRGPQIAMYANGGQCYMTNAFNASDTSTVHVAGIWHKRSGLDVLVGAVGNATIYQGTCSTWPLLTSTDAYRDRWVAQGVATKNGSTYTYTTDPVFCAWTDTDNDQVVDPSEVTLRAYAGIALGVSYVDRDLSVLMSGGVHLAPNGFTAAGAPIYATANATLAVSGLTTDTDTMIDAANGWKVLTAGPVCGYQNGTLTWTYPSEQRGVTPSTDPNWLLYAPYIGKPGELNSVMRVIGQTITPPSPSNAGELFAVSNEHGQVYLMTTDGLFVATLFKDHRQTPSWWGTPTWEIHGFGSYTAQRGMDVSGRSLGYSTFSTMISQTSDNNVYIIGGAEHSSITRVDGLSSITRLTPFTVTVDSTTHTGSANWQITHEQERQTNGPGRKTLTLQPYPFPLPIDGNTGEYRNWVEVYNWYPGTGLAGSVSAAVGYDDATLYCALNGGDLTNSASDMAHLFRTGGGIVLDLGTSASNPTRTAAQAGDLRLVVARTSGGATKATLYKQVATGGTSHTYTNGVRSVSMQDVQDVSSQVTLSGTEFSIPLSVLGFTPTSGQSYLGDLGLLLPKNGNETYRKVMWNNKAQGVLYDEPYEVQLYPQTWGRMVIGATLPKLSVPFTDNFNDGSLNTVWAAKNGTWSETGGILQQTSTTAIDPKKMMLSNAGLVPNNLEITAKVRVDSWTDGDSSRAGVSLNSGSADGYGYNLLFSNNHSTVSFLDDNVAWGPSYTFNWTNGTWYWFKMKYESGTLYGKVWQDGTSEPSTWPYTWAYSGRTGGYPALNGGSANCTVSFDDVTVDAKVATPTFDPPGALYDSAQTVTISSAMSGATIRYTTDGTDPTSSSTLYSTPITVSATTTVKAKAFKANLSDSTVGSATYTISTNGDVTYGLVGKWMLDNNLNDAVGTNTGTFAGGSPAYVTGKLSQALDFDGTDDALTLPYTPNDTASTISLWVKPTTVTSVNLMVRTNGNPWTSYTNQLRINANGKFEYYLYDGAARTVTGTTTAVANTWYHVVGVATSGGAMRLYVNGAEEGTSTTIGTLSGGDRYMLGTSAAVGNWCDGIVDDVRIYNRALSAANVSTLYDFYTRVATPTFSPAGGTYSSAQTVTISCATSGATIRYTTDDSDPTSGSTQYTSALTVSSTTTVKAKAFKSGMTDSAVGSATYTISSGTDVTSGLVAKWLLDNSLNDAVGSYTGTFAGGSPAYVTGKLNQALDFDGTDDALTLPYTPNDTANTISLWVKPTTATSVNLMVRTVNGGQWSSFSNQLRINANGKFEYYLWDGNARTVTGTTTASANTWYHVVGVATNSGAMRLYVNGVEEGTALTIATQYAGGLDRYMLGTGAGTVNWCDGIVDDIRVYNRALSSSEVSTLNNYYSGGGAVETPTFSPASGTYSSAQTVTISCATSGATIRYTTDGSDPTSSSTQYTSALTVSSTTTVKAKAFKSGMTDSAVGSATYTISSGTDVTNGLVAKWLLDNSLNDAVGSYTGTFAGGSPVYVTGKLNQAVDFDGTDDVLTLPYTPNDTANTISLWVKPTTATSVNLMVRTVNGGQWSSISNQLRINANGKFEYYLWDGSARTVTGTTTAAANTWYHVVGVATNSGAMRLYVNGAEEGTAVTIGTQWASGDRYMLGTSAAVGNWCDGIVDDIRVYNRALSSSEVSTLYNYYSGGGAVETPTFSPAGGTYSSAQTVTISCATSGATIRYTTDGSDPTSGSTQYTSALTVSSTITVKAKAFKSGMTDSAVGSATYTITGGTDVTNGLVAKWMLDNNLNDAVGSYTGTFAGGSPAYVTGKLNQALDFDGTDDALTLPYTPNDTANTISLWVKPTTATSVNLLVRTVNGGQWSAISNQLRINANGKFEYYLWDGSARTVTGTTTAAANTWYHLVGVATNSGAMRLYVNGAEEGTAVTIGTQWASGDRYMLGTSAAVGNWCDGIVDDVRVYNRALSSSDVSTLYNYY